MFIKLLHTYTHIYIITTPSTSSSIKTTIPHFVGKVKCELQISSENTFLKLLLYNPTTNHNTPQFTKSQMSVSAANQLIKYNFYSIILYCITSYKFPIVKQTPGRTSLYLKLLYKTPFGNVK